MAIQKASGLDRKFRALGDATRREIIHQLVRRREITASELVAHFSSSQPTISKHLRVLEDACLIDRRIDGRHHFFSLNGASLEEAECWLKRHRKFWSGSLDQLARKLDDDDAGNP